MFKHILLATDGSPASDSATALAVGLARQNGAVLTALYVIDPYPFIGVGDLNPAGFNAYMADAHRQCAAALAKVTDACARTQPPLTADVRVVEDAAVHTGILQTAQDQAVDLIVVGSHGRSGPARLVLGSVAAKVVAGAPVPVLVARGVSKAK